MSSHGEQVATPAGNGTSLSLPFHFTFNPCRRNSRSVWRRTIERFPPALSPANTMCSGFTASCREPGGG